jgi:hypothetical protein
MIIKFSKIAAVLAAALVTLGFCNIQCMKIKTESEVLFKIVKRLKKEKITANDAVLAMYNEDTRLISPDEVRAVQEWKKRLHQHEVEERGHFKSDQGINPTGAGYNRKGSPTQAQTMTLREGIEAIAAAEGFSWSRGGNSIMVKLSSPIIKNSGTPEMVCQEGKAASENKGAGGILKFGNTDSSDVGQIYLKK